MSAEVRAVDVARIIGLGANRPGGKPVVIDYRKAHSAAQQLYHSDKITYEVFELLEWCLWLHKAANKAMAEFEEIGLDDEAVESAWYGLLCTNEDTPDMVQELLQPKEKRK